MPDFWDAYDKSARQEDLRYYLDLFEDYLNVIEEFLEGESLEKAREDLGIRRQVDPKALPEEERDWYEFVSVGYFVDVLRRSFFVSLYGFLELQLMEECRYRQRKRDDVLLSVSDIRGHSDMDKVKTYFTKVLRIDFPRNSPEWGKINGGYRQLRNCIIHNGGRVDKRLGGNEKPLRDFIESEQSLSLHSHSDIVVLHGGFCKEALDTVRRFVWLLPA